MKQGRYSNDERRLYTHVQEDYSQNNNNKYHMHTLLGQATIE